MKLKQPAGSVAWHYVPNWPGKRCSAKTRRGTPCQRPGNKKTGRCHLHGGVFIGSLAAAAHRSDPRSDQLIPAPVSLFQLPP